MIKFSDIVDDFQDQLKSCSNVGLMCEYDYIDRLSFESSGFMAADVIDGIRSLIVTEMGRRYYKKNQHIISD